MGNENKKVVERDDADGLYSKKTLDNGNTVEILSRRRPSNIVDYTERIITPPPQSDTSYYVYSSVTPAIDYYVPARKYVTPTKYNKMGWLGKHIIGGVRPDSWDEKFDSYQKGGIVANDDSMDNQMVATQNNTMQNIGTALGSVGATINPMTSTINTGIQAINGIQDTSNNYNPEQTQFQKSNSMINNKEALVQHLENQPYGRNNVAQRKQLINMVRSFGEDSATRQQIWNNPATKPEENSAKNNLSSVGSLANQINSSINPAANTTTPTSSGFKSAKELPTLGFTRNSVEGFQEGGEVPSNDQQQLFVSIITDMAEVLGVEPSQELAEAVMTAFENNDDSQGLLTLFTKLKDKRMKETGLFKQGGKMNAFVEKYRCGGKTSHKKVRKNQPGGEIRYTENGEAPQGIELTRKQARELSKLNRGYSNENFRNAYQNAKQAIADNTDLRGRDKRMAARTMVSGISGLDKQLITPVTTPAPFTYTPAISGPSNVELGTYERIPEPELAAPAKPATPAKPVTSNDEPAGVGPHEVSREDGSIGFTKPNSSKPTRSVTSRVADDLNGTSSTGQVSQSAYNTLYGAGAKWGEQYRANRDARRAEREERRKNDPTYGDNALKWANAVNGAVIGSYFGPVGTVVGGVGGYLTAAAAAKIAANRRAKQQAAASAAQPAQPAQPAQTETQKTPSWMEYSNQLWDNARF